MSLEPVLRRLLLAGGLPRSGTTLLVHVLNGHPGIAAAIDNGAYESWALYRYADRTGLVADLRRSDLTAADAVRRLERHLLRGGEVWGVAPSSSVDGLPEVPGPRQPPPARPEPTGESLPHLARMAKFAFRMLLPRRTELRRHRVPVSRFSADLRLCLKSPEIVTVLPELAGLFPDARFVLVHRPLLEAAESMYRKGEEWELAYHRLWNRELDEDGRRIPPPPIHPEWTELWDEVTDFQRCVLAAASYARRLGEGLAEISPQRYLLYDHRWLRRDPQGMMPVLAAFLDVDPDGLTVAAERVRSARPSIPKPMRTEFDRLAGQLRLERWEERLGELEAS